MTILFFAVFSCVWAFAQTDTLAVSDTVVVEPLAVMEIPEVVDSSSVADTLELSDEDIMKMLASPQEDTVKKVVDRGQDVSRYVNARRQRSMDYSPFSNKPALANTFVSARLTSMKLRSADYGYGIMEGVSVGKWLHEDHAVRVDLSMGNWKDNHDGAVIRGMDITASYMFDLSSYVGGYRTNRLAEVYIVAGAGYVNNIHHQHLSHAVKGQVGMNLNLRIFKHIDFFVEPMATVYSNGMAVSYAGNWRWWLSGFQGSLGLSYNIQQSKSPDSPNLLPRKRGWFIALTGGPHVHNSQFVWTQMGLFNAIGLHLSLGVGKYYNDFFAMRYSAAYSRGPWIKYGSEILPCNYFAVRAESMVDFVSMISHAANGTKAKDHKLAVSLLFGPEVGYMYKVDAVSDVIGHVPVVESPYIGATGGVQIKVDLDKRMSIYLEPRLSFVPYEAPNLAQVGANKFLNYYDSVISANFGIQYLL